MTYYLIMHSEVYLRLCNESGEVLTFIEGAQILIDDESPYECLLIDFPEYVLN
jgi:hypothetical protein